MGNVGRLGRVLAQVASVSLLLTRRPVTLVTVGVLCWGVAAAQAEQIKRSFPTSATPSLLLHNHIGSITVQSWEQNAIEIQGERASEAMEVMIEGGKQKVTVQTHPSREQMPSQEARVDFRIRVPRQAMVRIDCERGDVIEVDDLQGNVFIEAVSSRVALSRIQGDIAVRTMDGSIFIQDSNGHIEARSISGDLKFVRVNGSQLVGSTNSGTVSYEGDFGSGGNYVLNNHSSWISILPSRQASFDLTARAVEGIIESDLPFHPIPLAARFRRLSPQKFIRGRFNSGESTVRITSFSGTIRLHRPQ